MYSTLPTPIGSLRTTVPDLLHPISVPYSTLRPYYYLEILQSRLHGVTVTAVRTSDVTNSPIVFWRTASMGKKVAYNFTLRITTVSHFESSVNVYQATRCHILEVNTLPVSLSSFYPVYSSYTPPPSSSFFYSYVFFCWSASLLRLFFHFLFSSLSLSAILYIRIPLFPNFVYLHLCLSFSFLSLFTLFLQFVSLFIVSYFIAFASFSFISPPPPFQTNHASSVSSAEPALCAIPPRRHNRTSDLQ